MTTRGIDGILIETHNWGATVVQPFEKQHWPALQMLLTDPDGRPLAVEAPLPAEK